MSEYQYRKQRAGQSSTDSKPILQEFRAILANTLPDAFSALLSLADEALFDRADAARNLNEQRSYFDAMRMLRNQRQSVIHKTLEAYFHTFDALLTNDLSLLVARSQTANNSLAILENHVLEEMIALDNIVSAIVAASGTELEFFNKRLEYLLGRPLRDEENPFVPEYLCEMLASQLAALHVDMGPRLLVLKHFEKCFVSLWPELVARCNQLLKDKGVRPDLEAEKRKVVKAKDDVKPSAAPRGNQRGETIQQAGPQNNRLQSNRAESGSSSQLLNDLDRLLRATLSAEESASAEGEPLAAAGAVEQMAAELDGRAESHALLQQLRDQGLEAVVAALLDARNQTITAMTSLDRSMIRVLDHAFKKLHARPMAPEELASLVLRMELPVAGMVLSDPHFFDKPNHPGRRLVNEIFKVTTTFLDGADAESDPLRNEVDKIVARLGKLDLSAKELARLLAGFVDFIEKDKRWLYAREHRLLEEEEAAVKVNQAHGFVYEKLSPLLLGKTVPKFLLKFCEDAWSKLMFLDLLREGRDSLVWKGQINEIGRIIDTVMAGNQVSVAESEAVLGLIQRRLEGVNLDPAALKRWLDIFAEYMELLVPGSEIPQNHRFDQVEVDNLILSLPGVVRVAPPDTGDVELGDLEAVDSLKQGVWVEFRATETSSAVRCKLAGVVKPVANYIFTNRKGVKVTEESRSRLAYKMKSGEVAVLDNSHLFDQVFNETIAEMQSQARKQRAQSVAH